MVHGVSINLVFYLFLAGMGAGAYCSAVLFNARDRYIPASGDSLQSYWLLVRIASLALVCIGALFLVVDLGVPQSFHRALESLGTSIISFGAFSIGIFVVFACLYLLVEGVRPKHWRALSSVCDVVAAVAGVAITWYTGYYLYSIEAVPFWHSLLLIALFMLSAFSCGIALLVVLAFFRSDALRIKRLVSCARLDMLLLALEAAVLACFMASRLFAGGWAARLAEVLLFGGLAPVFWVGLVLCGVVVAFASEWLALRQRGQIFFLVAACCSIAGGLALRACIILA